MTEGIDSLAAALPDSAVCYLADEATTDAIFGGDGAVKMGHRATFVFRQTLAYRTNVIPRQLRFVMALSWVTLATCRTLSTLIEHVLHIIFLGTKKKVVGPNTRSVITPMTNPLASWDQTIGQFPGNAMGKPLDRMSLDFFPEEHSIAIPIFRAVPEPTAILSTYLFPEPFGNRPASVISPVTHNASLLISSIAPSGG